MARKKHLLDALKVKAAMSAGAGKHTDGDGLYLFVASKDAAKWVFRYMRNGVRRDMGLGSARSVTLAEARAHADDARRAIRNGSDPVEARSEAKKSATVAPTFRQVADDMLASIEAGFRNPKHRQQWRNTLATYATPILDKPVDTIETAHLLECLAPIWTAKPETASRVRGRIERVLDAAKARGLRSGENPAAWRGHLALLLPKAQKLSRGHHAAMAYRDVPAFIGRLREVEGMSARALEFTILTAARSGEVLGATWREVDFEERIWTVPKGRMKAHREHRVPLTPTALAVLEAMRAFNAKDDPGAYVFPGQRLGRPLSVMSLAMVLRRLKIDATAHGFRSAFRDWAGDQTLFPREVAEAALAHAVGDATEQAYRRSDALEKRRKLMADWATWCEPKPDNVLTFDRRPRS